MIAADGRVVMLYGAPIEDATEEQLMHVSIQAMKNALEAKIDSDGDHHAAVAFACRNELLRRRLRDDD